MIFSKQNIFFKIIIISAIFGISFTTNLQTYSKLIILSFLYFLPEISILSNFAKIVIKFSFFFIAILVSGIIFNLDYFTQILFISKISMMILFLVYLRKTSTLNNFISDSKIIFGNSSKILLFLTSLSIFIDRHFRVFNSIKIKKNYITDVMKQVEEISSKTDEVHKQCLIMIKNNERRKFAILPNLYGFLFLSIVMIIRFS